MQQKSVNSRQSGRGKSNGNESLIQVSAGELLGRTHEELVLLLIQLRRHSATLCKAMENCHMDIEAQVLKNCLLFKFSFFFTFHFQDFHNFFPPSRWMLGFAIYHIMVAAQLSITFISYLLQFLLCIIIILFTDCFINISHLLIHVCMKKRFFSFFKVKLLLTN